MIFLICLIIAICLHILLSYIFDYFSYKYCDLFYNNLIECENEYCKYYKECKKKSNKESEK